MFLICIKSERKVNFLSNLEQILTNFEDNELIEAKLINGILVLLIGGNVPLRDDIKKALAPLE